jgi:hypothetical protein
MKHLSMLTLQTIADDAQFPVYLAEMTDAAGTYYQWHCDTNGAPYAPRMLDLSPTAPIARKRMDLYIANNARVLRRV